MSPALSIFCYMAVGTATLSGGIFLAASWALRRRDRERMRLEADLMICRIELNRMTQIAHRLEEALLAAQVRIVALETQSFLDRQPSPN